MLDPNLAEAHSALACATLLFERDYAIVEREFTRALELNPNYPQARAWYGLFFLQWVAGRNEEAATQVARLYEVDPLLGYANVILAFSSLYARRFEAAIVHAQRGAELDPASYLAHYCLANAQRLVSTRPSPSRSARSMTAIPSLSCKRVPGRGTIGCAPTRGSATSYANFSCRTISPAGNGFNHSDSLNAVIFHGVSARLCRAPRCQPVALRNPGERLLRQAPPTHQRSYRSRWRDTLAQPVDRGR